jgi:TonB family protein
MLLALTLNLSASTEFCATDGPLLTDGKGKPVWLDTDALLKDATHCVAPKMPALLRQAELDGYVSVDILVDQKGHVLCVQLISGHRMLASSAIDAARNWLFRPKKEKGNEVSFYGHLRFHFSTGNSAKDENPCTVAHW